MGEKGFQHALQFQSHWTYTCSASPDTSLPVRPYLDLVESSLTRFSMQDVAPVTNGGSDEDQARGRRDQETVAKWAQLWRTMILASLGKTLFPYSRYIRTLNLQDLEELLRDAKFRDQLKEQVSLHLSLYRKIRINHNYQLLLQGRPFTH